MVLSAPSIVSIVVSDVTANDRIDTTVSELALAENWSRYLKIELEIASGKKRDSRNECSASRMRSKTGSAVITPKIVVSNGTIDRMVVNVRLDATWNRRSWSARRNAKRTMSPAVRHSCVPVRRLRTRTGLDTGSAGR